MYVWDKTVQPALDQEWNLTLQQQVSPTMTFQVGYVAQKADHLMVPMPYLQKQLVNGVATTPFYFNNNPALINDLGQVSGTASVGYMNYNSLQAVLREADVQWSRWPGGLYLVALPDQQQRLLRNVGSRGWEHDSFTVLIRICTTPAPITPVATTTPTTSSPPMQPMICLSEEESSSAPT